MGVEPHQIPGEPRGVGVIEQVLAAFRLLDFAGAGEQGIEVAICLDQLRGGLDADAGDAGHVVDGIAGQRLHVDHLVRSDAELFAHLVRSDGAVLHGVHHD